MVWKDKTAMRGQIYYDTSNDMKIASGGTGVKVTLDSSGNLYPGPPRPVPSGSPP